MFGFARLRLPQPKTRHPVYEFAVTNFFGRWMDRKGWYGLTLPFGLFVVVLYWCRADELQPIYRVHEFKHVEQAERPGPFYWQYFKALRHGYDSNPLEAEANEAVRVALREGLPDWA